MTKIVLIGAGSYAFGTATFRDLMAWREQLRGSTITLVDVNQEYLTLMTNFFHKLNEMTGNPYIIESTTDRTQALPGADFVFISIAVNRNERWKLDWNVPFKYGVKHVLGENGGPGGLFHAMRNIPIVLDIVHDVEKFAPEAFVINFTNPEGRICQAINRYSKVKFVGLCHGIDSLRRVAGYALDLPPEKIDVKAGGLNHFSWVRDLRHMDTGEDLYPAFRKAVHERQAYIEEQMHHTMKLSVYLMDTFGLYPLPSDNHVGEYISYAWELAGMEGHPFDLVDRESDEFRADIRLWTSGEKPMPEWMFEPSGERAVAIVDGILHNTHQYEISVNIPNKGYIPNLPDDAIVEVPAVIDATGVHGVSLDPLPEPIAAMCRTQINIIDRVVEAGVHGDKQAALQALLLDPVISSVSQAQGILDELLEAHKDFLPQFNK
ncbi:MAG: alpha-glucosidase/alpha-galactosidase [Chloroflexota bacterium]